MERPELQRWSSKSVAKVLSLFDAERRFHEEMVTLLPVPVATVAANGEVLAANLAFLDTFGVDRGQLENRNLAEFAGTAAVLASLQPRQATRVEQAGRVIHLVPLSRWERGEIEWMAAFLPRATAAANDLEPALHASAAAVGATQRLAQTVTHEANNLVMIASGYGQEILKQLPPNSPLREDVAALLDATKRIAAMTTLLADYGRPRKPDIEACRLEEFAPGVAVAVDRNALEEALAAARSLAGGKLHIEPAPKPPYLMLELSGFPMTGEALRQMLEPLSKLARLGDDTARVASRIGPLLVQAGARWTVTDAPSIEIYLPLAAAEAAAAPAPAVPEKLALVVDDQAGIRRILRRVLEGMGYAVEEAGSGEEAASWLDRRETGPQLLVTDMRMPGMSGSDVAGRVRFRFPETNILFISGYTDDPAVQSGRLPERSRFLSKPFDPEQLRKTVTDLMA